MIAKSRPDEDDGQAMAELSWRAIRAEGQEASASKILEGATAWREPAYFKDGRREFEQFIAIYAAARVGGEGSPGMEHDEAIERMKESAADEG